jgi:hypothetical protein
MPTSSRHHSGVCACRVQLLAPESVLFWLQFSNLQCFQQGGLPWPVYGNMQRSDILIRQLQSEVDTFHLANHICHWLLVNTEGASITKRDEAPDAFVETALFLLIVS